MASLLREGEIAMKNSVLLNVVVLLLLAADLNAQNVPVEKRSFGVETREPYVLDGLNFSPYKDGQNPELECCRQISENQLRERMAIVSPHTKWIRTFSCRFGLEKAGRSAHEMGHQAAIGAWLGPETTAVGQLANQSEIDSLIKRANAGEVDLAIVGSEVLLRGDLSEARLLEYINQVRQAIPANIPVTTADVYGFLLSHPAIIDAIDVVFVNYYPYWEGVDVNKAIARLNCWHQRMLVAAKGKQVIVSETGWPSCGDTLGCAVPSPENASFYFLNFISWARANQVSYFYFSAFDESWKAINEGPQGACWGIWDKDGNLKPGMQRVFDGDTIPNNWDKGEIPGGVGTPTIELTCVPPYGSKEFLQGQVWRVRPDDFKVAVYIYIAQLNGWWSKPTFDQKLTTINCDGSWAANIVTGGIDERATMLVAFLVPNGYVPWEANWARELRTELDSVAIAWVARTRVPGAGAWSLMKKEDIIEIAYSSGTEFPQYAALHAKDGYFRMNYGPGSGWGTSAILLPSFWEGGALHQGAPITTICKHDGADLLLSIAGNISSLRVRGQVRLLPPQQDTVSARVTMGASGNLRLDQRPGEAFKPVMLSSMHVSGERWDASSAYVDAQTFQIPDSGWIIHPPIMGSVFGLNGGASQWKTNAPTIEVELDESRPITGWVTPSCDPNDDNVGLWAASDSVMHAWQYTLVAKKPNPTTSVEEIAAEIPTSFDLKQNFPNPFNPSTTIRFSMLKPARVTIKIYDVQGREVRMLIDRPFAAGRFAETWDGRNSDGVLVTSGVYFVQMQTAEFVRVRKLVLVR
jgi:exo-beta-1,3-glucanase (GH17 family)